MGTALIKITHDLQFYQTQQTLLSPYLTVINISSWNAYTGIRDATLS